MTFGNGSTGVTGTFAGGATSQDGRLEFHATVAPDPNQRGAADTFLAHSSSPPMRASTGTLNTLIVGDWRNLGVWKTPLASFGTSLPATFVGPSLAASPSPVALVAQVGGTASQTVTITNGGTSFTVTFGTLGIAGAGLTLANDTCSGQTVGGSGGTCSIQVNFTPGATGPVDGSLSAPIAGAGSPVTTTIPSVFVTDIDATGTPPTLPARGDADRHRRWHGDGHAAARHRLHPGRRRQLGHLRGEPSARHGGHAHGLARERLELRLLVGGLQRQLAHVPSRSTPRRASPPPSSRAVSSRERPCSFR